MTARVGIGAAVGALLGCVVLSLVVGAMAVPFGEVVRALAASDGSDAHVVVTELRVPRTLLGVLVGAALGAAGALMQGVTRNPLAEPGILGVNAGAAFAVVLAIFVLGVGTVAGYAAFALLGAGVAALVVYALGASGGGGATPVKLALAGAVLTALLTALTSAILVLDAHTLDEFRFWIVGSIAGRDASVLLDVLPFLATGLVLAVPAGRWLNTLALGDDVARSLGQRTGRVRMLAGASFVLCAGGAVAAAGPIAFVGLTVPHIARGLVGPDYRWIVPYSAVLGAVLVIAADVLGRVIARPAEIEVGIVTAALGAPFFIWLVRRRRLAAL
jgi:iron complex transport system permease protein